MAISRSVFEGRCHQVPRLATKSIQYPSSPKGHITKGSLSKPPEPLQMKSVWGISPKGVSGKPDFFLIELPIGIAYWPLFIPLGITRAYSFRLECRWLSDLASSRKHKVEDLRAALASRSGACNLVFPERCKVRKPLG